MTYRQLLQWLQELTDEQLDSMDVTVHDVESDEFYRVSSAYVTEWTDVLDARHPVLCIKDPEEAE